MSFCPAELLNCGGWGWYWGAGSGSWGGSWDGGGGGGGGGTAWDGDLVAIGAAQSAAFFASMGGPSALDIYLAGVNAAFAGGKRKYTVKLEVLNDCLSKIGIKTTIDSFTPSTPGGYGKASGKGEDWFSGHGNTVPITVTNDANTYNATQIGTKVKSRSGYAFGFTDPKSPYTNYTNNNNSPYGTVHTQVWELGNSLWVIQTLSPLVPVPTGDNEPGNVLEKCVRAGHGIQAQ